jgi:F0F1-type ATP synthase epsilon subunit
LAQSRRSPLNNETIHLTIRNRENILYDADIHALTALNGSGPLDVLPEHANFISIIEKYVIIHEVNGKTNQMKIEIAVLHVHEGGVDIYLSER